jgi:hypothetical protein
MSDCPLVTASQQVQKIQEFLAREYGSDPDIIKYLLPLMIQECGIAVVTDFESGQTEYFWSEKLKDSACPSC